MLPHLTSLTLESFTFREKDNELREAQGQIEQLKEQLETEKVKVKVSWLQRTYVIETTFDQCYITKGK